MTSGLPYLRCPISMLCTRYALLWACEHLFGTTRIIRYNSKKRQFCDSILSFTFFFAIIKMFLQQHIVNLFIKIEINKNVFRLILSIKMSYLKKLLVGSKFEMRIRGLSIKLRAWASYLKLIRYHCGLRIYYVCLGAPVIDRRLNTLMNSTSCFGKCLYYTLHSACSRCGF